MLIRQDIELNDIVCIEVNPTIATVHMKGGRYFNVEIEVARQLQNQIGERLQKVMSVFGDVPKNENFTTKDLKGLNS